MHYYIKAQTFLTKSGVKTGGYLEIKDGKFGCYLPPETDLSAATIIDKKDAIIAPGLVDTHIHGYAGHDVMDADPAGLAEISQGLLSCGVTSYLPTTLTAPPQKLAQVCQLLGEKAHEISGAKIQGIYLEDLTLLRSIKERRTQRICAMQILLSLKACKLVQKE